MSEPNITSVRAFIGAVAHHWMALMSGGLITVGLGLFERFSGKNVPLWVYGLIVVLFICMACYLAWRDSQKKVGFSDAENQRRKFLAERLTSLLHEAGRVEFGAVSLRSIEGMGKMWRQSAYHERAKNFVKENYGPETASRYDKEKSDLLEELLADCHRAKDDTKPDIRGAIEQVIEKKLLPSKDAGIAGFDYYFTLQFWLRNVSAPSNFHNFALSIFVDNKVYEGEILSLSGHCLNKQLPQQTGAHTELERVHERLQDFDALTALERNSSRHGSLRFVVRNVVWNQKDDSANYISRIELTVTDGSGGQSVLAYKPPWSHESPNLEVIPCHAHTGKKT